VADVCRSIIADSDDFEPLAEKYQQFVVDLFKRHPDYLEKAFPGIRGFSVATDSRWGTTRHFIVHRADETSIDFSWKICIDGQLPDRRIDVLASMRSAVADQILGFRAKQFLGKSAVDCPITGQAVSRNDSHVDHVSPRTSLALTNKWLESSDLSFDQVQLVRSADVIWLESS